MSMRAAPGRSPGPQKPLSRRRSTRRSVIISFRARPTVSHRFSSPLRSTPAYHEATINRAGRQLPPSRDCCAPKPELLCAGGDLEKLRFPMLTRDAAYIGAGPYSLRQSSGFSLEQMAEAIALARARGKKLYVALNAYMRNRELADLPAYLDQIAVLGPHGLIISDPSLLPLARSQAPNLPLHLSTQVNTTNWQAAEFWRGQGVSRINLARELSLAEAAEMPRARAWNGIFVTALCASLFRAAACSATYMTGRSANRGNCKPRCRYRYALQERKKGRTVFPH